jgi:hypothetical protein
MEATKVTDSDTPPVPRSGLPAALRALKHRNFQLFFGGQLISVTGTWMQTVALSWLVYRLTGSTLLLGTVGFASQIPILAWRMHSTFPPDRRSSSTWSARKT